MKDTRKDDPKARIDAQTERLPGDIHFHLKELRTSRGWSQGEAAKVFGVGLSKYKLMESSDDQAVDHRTIQRACDVYEVSADYLLGRTTIEFPTAEYIESLGLSKKSLKKLTARSTDRKTLNRIIEHRSFFYFMWAVSMYVKDITLNANRIRNEQMMGGLLAMEAAMKMFPDKQEEIREDMFQFRSELELQADEKDLETVIKNLKRILHAVREDVRKERNAPEYITRTELRDSALSFYRKRQGGEKVSFLTVIKKMMEILFRKAPMFRIREGEKANEMIVTLPDVPEKLERSYAEMRKENAELFAGRS